MSSSGSNTNQPRGSRKAIYIGIILILVVVTAALAFLLLNRGSAPSADLKITQYERNYVTKVDIGGGDFAWAWTVNLKIENRGSNNVNGAELVTELKADHTTIFSYTQTITIQAGWTNTEPIPVNAKQSQWLSKNVQFVATIYLNNQVIDQYTTNW